QHLIVRRPSALRDRNLQRHQTPIGEFERVGKQVLENLLQALGVGLNSARKIVGKIDLEIELLAFCNVPECALHVILQLSESKVPYIDHDRARFDLRQVENVVDQRQQIVA